MKCPDGRILSCRLNKWLEPSARSRDTQDWYGTTRAESSPWLPRSTSSSTLFAALQLLFNAIQKDTICYIEALPIKKSNVLYSRSTSKADILQIRCCRTGKASQSCKNLYNHSISLSTYHFLHPFIHQHFFNNAIQSQVFYETPQSFAFVNLKPLLPGTQHQTQSYPYLGGKKHSLFLYYE